MDRALLAAAAATAALAASAVPTHRVCAHRLHDRLVHPSRGLTARSREDSEPLTEERCAVDQSNEM